MTSKVAAVATETAVGPVESLRAFVLALVTHEARRAKAASGSKKTLGMKRVFDNLRNIIALPSIARRSIHAIAALGTVPTVETVRAF